jgi:REP element-mobilizing transposase RayT
VVSTYLRLKLREVRQHYPDWQFTAMGLDVDHAHLHLIIPPRYSVSFAVETLKKDTSRALRERFPFLD